MSNTKMLIDIEVVRQLAEVVNAARLTTLDVRYGRRRIQIRREPSVQAMAKAGALMHSDHEPLAMPIEADVVIDQVLENSEMIVRSPYVGTVNLVSDVDGRPFAFIGRVVTTGDTLLLIEILNVRMPIVIRSTGVVVAVEVRDGETVEFNQILAVIK